MQGLSADVPSSIDFSTPITSRVIGSVIDYYNSVTLSFNDDFYWSTALQAISFGPGLSYKLQGDLYAIFDTGNSNILVPTLMFKPILD
jgi:hypothetical protein